MLSVIMAASALAVALVLLHMVYPYDVVTAEEDSGSYRSKINTPLTALSCISGVIASFSQCIPSAAACSTESKSVEKSLIQLKTSLTSKAFRKFVTDG
jgi:hypothetical protein